MIEEVDIEQGKFLMPKQRTAKVKYVHFDEHGNLEIKENKYSTDIKCIAFSVFGDDTVEDLKNNVYCTANEFGAKKIVWRVRPSSYKDTSNFVATSNISADCVCYLIVDGEVNA